MIQVKQKNTLKTVVPEIVSGTDGGVFSEDEHPQSKRFKGTNRVMPQTDIEYERDQLSNPKYHVHTDDEQSKFSYQNKRNGTFEYPKAGGPRESKRSM